MAVAKVEPLLTARALRGPFDYALPERLAGVGVGSVLLVPFGRQRVVGVVVEVAESSDLPPERLAEPLEALEAGATPELVRLGQWVAREYCSTPARGLELVLPPGVGRSGRGPAARTELRAKLTDAGRAALEDGARLGSIQRAVITALAEADAAGGGELTARELQGAGADTAALRRMEARGLVELRATQRARRPVIVDVGARSSRPELNAAQSAALGTITDAIDRSEHAELLLWASPDPARPRSTWQRPKRRWPAAAARLCWSPRSRSRRRPSPDSPRGSATAWRCFIPGSRRASAATSGTACDPARRPSASAPDRRSSLPFRIRA